MSVEAKREGGQLCGGLGEVGGIQLIAWHQQDQYMTLSNIGTAASQKAGPPCPGTEAPFHETVQQMCQVRNAARPMGDDCGTEAQGRALGQRSVGGRNGEPREPGRATLYPTAARGALEKFPRSCPMELCRAVAGPQQLIAGASPYCRP